MWCKKKICSVKIMVSIINTSKSSGPYFAQNALNLVTILCSFIHMWFVVEKTFFLVTMVVVDNLLVLLFFG